MLAGTAYVLADRERVFTAYIFTLSVENAKFAWFYAGFCVTEAKCSFCVSECVRKILFESHNSPTANLVKGLAKSVFMDLVFMDLVIILDTAC